MALGFLAQRGFCEGVSPSLSIKVLAFCLLLFPANGFAEIPAVEVAADRPYKSGGLLTPYEKVRCKLDVYVPSDAKDLPCLVWFHGGNLVGGAKNDGDVGAVARALASDGFVVAVANYRLSPKVTYPAYLEDAAAAVAWMRANASRFGGDAKKLFIGGHSAGGYLTVMLGADPRWLKKQGMTPDDVAGLVSLSGQMFTHGTVRAERGLPATTVVIDEAAPVNHAGKHLPPLLLLYAGNDLPFRGAENRYFAEALESAGNDHFVIRRIEGRDHGSINGSMVQAGDEVRTAILEFVKTAGGPP